MRGMMKAAVIQGLSGASGFGLGGRPILTFLSSSTMEGAYRASLVMGWIPAVSMRFRTASTEIFNSLAISDTVIPSIPLISESIQKKLKKVSIFLENSLDKVSILFDTLHR